MSTIGAIVCSRLLLLEPQTGYTTIEKNASIIIAMGPKAMII